MNLLKDTSTPYDFAGFGYGCLAFLSIVCTFVGTAILIIDATFNNSEAAEFTNADGYRVLGLMLTFFASIIIGLIVGSKFRRLMIKKMQAGAMTGPGLVAAYLIGLAGAVAVGLIILALLAMYIFFYMVCGFVVFFLFVSATTK